MPTAAAPQKVKISPARRVLQVLLIVLPPFTAALLMQFILGVNPGEMSFGAVLGNALYAGVLYFLLYAATGKPMMSLMVLHGAFGGWGAANYFVILFRGLPILPWDLTALGTAADVAGNYNLFPTGRMWVGILVLCGIFIASRILHRKKLLGKGAPSLYPYPRRTFLIAGAVCLVLVLLPGTMPALGVSGDVWNQAGAYRKSGAAAAFFCNVKYMNVEKPENADPETVDEIANAISPSSPSPAAPEQQPNIIAIMNESWADFESYGNLSLTDSTMEHIRALDNAIVGKAYTSVFGAGTSASEFEFLTGNSMAFLPSGSIPYQQYLLGPSASLASLLKAQGYATLAFHPGEYTSWQRNQAYPRLGFDAYKCGADMDVPQTFEHGYVSDDSDFDQVIWEYEHRDPSKPLFLFNVTIQNHGGYAVEDYPAQVQLTDEPGKYPKAEQYLTLANLTDEAFQKLVDYFSAQEEPTIILMFGDHQPSVEQEFLDKAYGVTQDEMTMEQYMGKFQTPFVIWANYPLEDGGPEMSSLNFLGQYLLHYAGVKTSVYEDFLTETQETLPAFTFVGYFDQSGKAYSHLSRTEYDDLIEKYQIMQYNNLFGGDDRRSEYFDAVIGRR